MSKLIKEQRSEPNKTADVLHEPEEEHQKEVESQTILSEQPLYSDTPNLPAPLLFMRLRHLRLMTVFLTFQILEKMCVFRD